MYIQGFERDQIIGRVGVLSSFGARVRCGTVKVFRDSRCDWGGNEKSSFSIGLTVVMYSTFLLLAKRRWS